MTSAEAQRVKELERVNKELRRANDILKPASTFLVKFRYRSFSRRRSSTAVSDRERLCRYAARDSRGRVDLQDACGSPPRATGVTPRASVIRPNAARDQRDDTLMSEIERAWQAKLSVYGADKLWRQLQRDGTEVARRTVERLS